MAGYRNHSRIDGQAVLHSGVATVAGLEDLKFLTFPSLNRLTEFGSRNNAVSRLDCLSTTRNYADTQ